MNGVPTVSVCIPTYRGAALLGQAIDSVLAQHYTDFELLIIDNHSGDGTDQLVASYTDPRIRYLCNARNLGAEANWNRCLDEARGRYIKLLPHDDLIAPDCLARQVEVLERDQAQAIALVYCARTVIDAGGRAVMVRGGARRGGVVAGPALVRRCLRRGTNLIGEPGAVLFRRQLARTVGPFDASLPYVVDLDYWCRLLRHGDACHLPQPLASFRLSRAAWSVALERRQGADFRRFMDRLAADPRYALGPAGTLAGRLMASLNGGLRLAFYRLLLD
ncbi:glycosyltransferase [Duganella sp. LX20W]|uniref:Glycosyltransferase n=1 Tax=Rugamonas brunnea TaxID=2758569 RepID=A0A7W2EUW4_9BURK|nr:glycosyltransferase [Rugamonas brunnea]MBA5639016.1 glycosyltransferase [Rugamonas brunnea]